MFILGKIAGVRPNLGRWVSRTAREVLELPLKHYCVRGLIIQLFSNIYIYFSPRGLTVLTLSLLAVRAPHFWDADV